MINPLVSSSIVKTRLRENILEIINSNDEKLLDISIVCEDGSFLWSQFLLAAASDFFATAMQGIELTHVIFPDSQVEDVRGSLLGLIEPGSPYTASVQTKYECNEKSPVSVDLDDQLLPIQNGDMVKVEIDSDHDNCIEPQIDNQEEKAPENKKESLDSKIKIDNGRNSRKLSSKEKKPTVWVRDPSPDRFVDGKKVKYICVTQDNVAKGPPYHCVDCSYKSNEIVNVKKHYRKHSKVFSCKDCGKKFSKSISVVSHWNKFHNKEKISSSSSKSKLCPFCGKKFEYTSEDPKNYKNFQNHVLVHKVEQFTCECQETWENIEQKKRHMKVKHKGHTPCTKCSATFKKLDLLDIHMEQKHNEENQTEFLCSICGKSFKSNGILQNHRRSAHDKNIIKCDICYKDFEGEHRMKEHIRRMHNEKSISKNPCSECGKTFDKKVNLFAHQQNVHDKNIVKCDICDQEFEGTYTMKAHRRKKHTHANNYKPKPCPHCGVLFSKLRSHIKTVHTDEKDKKFVCDLCHKGFETKKNLNRHAMSVHIKARPFKCRYGCSFAYNDFSNRNSHERKKHGGIGGRSDEANNFINTSIESN